MALPFDRILVIQSLSFLWLMSHLSFSRAHKICDCFPQISIKQDLSSYRLMNRQCPTFPPTIWPLKHTLRNVSLLVRRKALSLVVLFFVQNMPTKKEGFLLTFFWISSHFLLKSYEKTRNTYGHNFLKILPISLSPRKLFVHYLSCHI